MPDPFARNSKAQLIREAQVGLSLVAILLVLFVYVAYYRITGQGMGIPDHVRRSPIAQSVWPNENLADNKREFAIPQVARSSFDQPRSQPRIEKKVDQKMNAIAQLSDSNLSVKSKNPTDRVTSLRNPTTELTNQKSVPLAPRIDSSRNQLATLHWPVVDDPFVPSNKKASESRLDSNSLSPSPAMHSAIVNDSIPSRREQIESPGDRQVASTFEAVPSNDFRPEGHSQQILGVGKSAPQMRSPIPIIESTESVSREVSESAQPTLHVNQLRSGSASPGFASTAPAHESQFNSEKELADNRYQNPPSQSNQNNQNKFQAGVSQFGARSSLPVVVTPAADFIPTEMPLDSTTAAVNHDVPRGIPAFDKMTSPQNQIGTLNSSNLAVEPDMSSTSVQSQDTRRFLDERNSFASFHIVQTGESFWTIAQTRYGDGRFFRALYKFNELNVVRFDELATGTRIETPTIEELSELWPDLCPAPQSTTTSMTLDALEASGSSNDSLRYYVTRDGDTLFEIAGQRLGQASRYLEIMQLNSGLLPVDVNHLTPLRGRIHLVMPTSTIQ